MKKLPQGRKHYESMIETYLCIAAATSVKPCGDVLLRSQCTTDNFLFTWSSFDSALAPESPAWLPLMYNVQYNAEYTTQKRSKLKKN